MPAFAHNEKLAHAQPGHCLHPCQPRYDTRTSCGPSCCKGPPFKCGLSCRKALPFKCMASYCKGLLCKCGPSCCKAQRATLPPQNLLPTAAWHLPWHLPTAPTAPCLHKNLPTAAWQRRQPWWHAQRGGLAAAPTLVARQKGRPGSGANPGGTPKGAAACCSSGTAHQGWQQRQPWWHAQRGGRRLQQWHRPPRVAVATPLVACQPCSACRVPAAQQRLLLFQTPAACTPTRSAHALDVRAVMRSPVHQLCHSATRCVSPSMAPHSCCSSSSSIFRNTEAALEAMSFCEHRQGGMLL